MSVVPSVSVAVGLRSLEGGVEPGALVTFAPDYELFRGKSWESEYPKALVEYYRAVSGFRCKGCATVCGAFSCEGSSCGVGGCGRGLDGERFASDPVRSVDCVSGGRGCDDTTFGDSSLGGCGFLGEGVAGCVGVGAKADSAASAVEPEGLNGGVREVVPEWRRNPPRGPNYARNQASREKKKLKKQCERSVVLRVDPDAELAAEVRRMRLERQKIQEQRKLDKLKSPVQMIEDAMRQVALAEKYAKLANDSKVAEWAAKLSSASAESIALSAGAKSTDVGSGKASTVGTSYTKAVVDKFSVKRCPMTISEKTAVDVKVVRVDQVESLRRKINRTLTARDFMFADFPHPITMAQKIQIREAEDFCDTENIPIIEF